jgi:tRNA G18 (ribose-2'-O)-methylase SpoU
VRRRRYIEAFKEAAIASRTNPLDPGLREAYASLPKVPIRLICSPMDKVMNHGGLLRIAEAFRLEMVSFANEPSGEKDFSGGRGTWNWQPFEWKEPLDAVAEAKAQGRRIYCLALDERAQVYNEIDWQFPAALVVGEEEFGIHPEVLAMADEVVAIPLYGLITSMNVGQAAAIVLASMVAACPDIEPARNISRTLLGLEPVSYEPPAEEL